MSARKVGFIGFGEAAMAFATGWNSRVAFELSAYDIKTDKPELCAQKLADYDITLVTAAHSPDELAQDADMNVTIVQGNIGAASTIKMIRSIMVKGMDALTAECFLAARMAGIDPFIAGTCPKLAPFRREGIEYPLFGLNPPYHACRL